MSTTLALGAVTLVAGPSHAQDCSWSESEKVTANDGSTGDTFGVSVSLWGDTALVGAQLEDGNGSDAGSAYVFVRSGTTWAEQAKLMASDGAPGGSFGVSVSLWENTALIGAYGDADSGNLSGAAYVFVRSGTTWREQVKLTASDAAPGDFLGVAVSVSGDRALVGAHRDDDNGLTSGSAYVFARNGTSWSQETKLTAGDGAGGDWFGRAVSLYQGVALVGAEHDDDEGAASGSAYVFVRDGAVWREQAKLTASDGSAGDFLGAAVSLPKKTALIGAYGEDERGSNAGAAYVFAQNGTTWSEEAKLTASDGAKGDFLGESVSIFGETALLGARSDFGYAPDSGAAYVFRLGGSTWNERGWLAASDGWLGDDFGGSVSLFEETALIGARRHDESGTNSGAAYVFDGFEPVIYCTAKTLLVCGEPAISLAGVPSASVSSGFVIAANPARSNRSGLFFYTHTGRANNPFDGGVLCVPPPYRRSVNVHSGGSATCDGVFSIDWYSFAHGLLGGNPQPFLLSPGQQVNVQVWGRDSVATGSLLSDALEYVVCD